MIYRTSYIRVTNSRTVVKFPSFPGCYFQDFQELSRSSIYTVNNSFILRNRKYFTFCEKQDTKLLSLNHLIWHCLQFLHLILSKTKILSCLCLLQKEIRENKSQCKTRVNIVWWYWNMLSYWQIFQKDLTHWWI